MFSLSVKLGIEPIRKWIEKEVGESEKKIEKQVKDACFKIERKTKQNLRKHVSSGRLIKSYASDVRLKGFDSWGRVGSDADYARPVEGGSRPHFPPVAALERWAKQKGINPWALAKSIAKKGTEAHPHFEPACEDILRGTIWEL